MRLMPCLALCALAAPPAPAQCPAPGQMPERVTFAEGLVEDGFAVDGTTIESVTTFADGRITILQSAYGLYPLNLVSGETALSWTWDRPELPAPADLPPGQDVTVSASIQPLDDSPALMVRYTWQSQGAEDLAVGDCTLSVIRLTERQDFQDGSGAILSELWIDPQRMIILRTRRDKQDGSGAVVDHREAHANGFELAAAP